MISKLIKIKRKQKKGKTYFEPEKGKLVYMTDKEFGKYKREGKKKKKPLLRKKKQNKKLSRKSRIKLI